MKLVFNTVFLSFTDAAMGSAPFSAVISPFTWFCPAPAPGAHGPSRGHPAVSAKFKRVTGAYLPGDGVGCPGNAQLRPQAAGPFGVSVWSLYYTESCRSAFMKCCFCLRGAPCSFSCAGIRPANYFPFPLHMFKHY